MIDTECPSIGSFKFDSNRVASNLLSPLSEVMFGKIPRGGGLTYICTRVGQNTRSHGL